MKQLAFIGTCQNGKKVYDRFPSHWHKDVSKEVLLEALSKLAPHDIFHKEVIDMKYIIGKSHYVEVSKEDDIVYVIRKKKRGPTPMVRNKVPSNSSLLTVLLKQIGAEDYILLSTYIGEGEPEPWDFHFYYKSSWEKNPNLNYEEYQRSVDFWNTHALVYDENDIALHLSI